MCAWSSYVKKGLQIAIKNQEPKQIANQLRHSARKAFQFGEKGLSIQLIKLCLDFSEGTNLYLLAFKDYHYYKTGVHLNNQTPQVQAPEPQEKFPWGELEQIITRL